MKRPRSWKCEVWARNIIGAYRYTRKLKLEHPHAPDNGNGYYAPTLSLCFVLDFEMTFRALSSEEQYLIRLWWKTGYRDEPDIKQALENFMLEWERRQNGALLSCHLRGKHPECWKETDFCPYRSAPYYVRDAAAIRKAEKVYAYAFAEGELRMEREYGAFWRQMIGEPAIRGRFNSYVRLASRGVGPTVYTDAKDQSYERNEDAA